MTITTTVLLSTALLPGAGPKTDYVKEGQDAHKKVVDGKTNPLTDPIIVASKPEGRIDGYAGYAGADHTLMLTLFDKNKDGKLSVDELTTGGAGAFAVADVNDDKFIDSDEWKALILFQDNAKGNLTAAIADLPAADRPAATKLLNDQLDKVNKAIKDGVITAKRNDHTFDTMITPAELKLSELVFGTMQSLVQAALKKLMKK